MKKVSLLSFGFVALTALSGCPSKQEQTEQEAPATTTEEAAPAPVEQPAPEAAPAEGTTVTE